MSGDVYSFENHCEEMEFVPFHYNSARSVPLLENPKGEILKHGSKLRTSSSNDILLQIQNSNRPTPNNNQIVPIPQAPKHSILNRLLRHSNSESCLGQNNEDGVTNGYRSPHAYLLVKRYQPNEPDLISKLSDELLMKIFQYLPKVNLVRCSKVNRRFHRLSLDETLWKRLDLGLKRLSESILHRLINRGIQILRLCKAEIDIDSFDPAKAGRCRLQYLDLSMLVANDSCTVRKLLSRCRNLIGLSLESCDVDDECCTYIGENSNLKFLNVTLCRGVSNSGLDKVLKGCKQLVELNMAWTMLEKEVVEQACNTMPSTLTRLNFAGCRFSTMDDEDVANLVDRCPLLIELDLSDCTDLTGKSLEYVSENLRHLQVLHCSRCYAIEPNSYTSYCKHLKELNILGTIKDESMPVLKRALSHVEINVTMFSTIARPTVGIRRTSIWEQRVRDC